ncbi:MAG TPA: hypothetical protein VFM51_02725 [Solirubrobacterales bacterium]|nr:hypothetical protein [Solirubrobacterales bacterium]
MDIRVFSRRRGPGLDRRSHFVQEGPTVKKAGELKNLDCLLVETNVYLSLRHSRFSVRVDC